MGVVLRKELLMLIYMLMPVLHVKKKIMSIKLETGVLHQVGIGLYLSHW